MSLAEFGSSHVGPSFEENIIYSSPDLLGRSSIVRIRVVDGTSLMTFKRRLESRSDVKEQIEYETEVANVAETQSILEELGLSPRVIYEKRRDTWRLRSAEVVLDELPFGNFMEIEGTVSSIREVEMLLGIEDVAVELETYPRLTARLGVDVNGVVEARFNAAAS